MSDQINKKLLDAGIERDKHLQAKSAAIIAAAIALLDASEPELRILLERYLALLTLPGVDLSSPAIQAQIIGMRQNIRNLRGRYLDFVSNNIQEQGDELIRNEWDFLAATYAAEANISLFVPNGNTIQAILATPYEGRDFATWMNDLAVSDSNRISDAVVTGLIQEQGRQAIMESVLGEEGLDGGNGTTQITRNNLRSLVDTATVAWAAQATVDLLDIEENAVALPRELYVAVIDGRTTPICRKLNGRVFPVGEGPIPPLHWFCRSRRIALPPEGAVPDLDT